MPHGSQCTHYLFPPFFLCVPLYTPTLLVPNLAVVLFFPSLRGFHHHALSVSVMLQNTSISQKGALMNVWCPDFNGCLPGTIPLTPVSGGQGGLQSRVLWDSTTENPILDLQSLTGSCTDSRLKHNPSFSMKEACLSRSSSLRGRLLLWHIIIGLWRCSQGTEAGKLRLCAFPPLLQVSSVSQKGTYALVQHATFVAAAKGHLYIAWQWLLMELMTWRSHSLLTKGESS